MSVTENDIQQSLINFCHGSYDILLPNFFYGWHECDLFRITSASYVVEYEIKISRSDYFADFKKDVKHKKFELGDNNFCANKFYFAVPEDLISKSEVPKYAGLIYYKDGFCKIVKVAKFIHKTQFSNYKWIAHQLSNRCMFARDKMRRLKIGTYTHQINNLIAKNKILGEQLTEERNKNFLLKYKDAI